MSPYVFPGLLKSVRVAPQVALDIILRAVQGETDVSVAEILSASRRRKVAKARQIAVWLALRHHANSLSELGRYFDMHHTSVMYCRDAAQRMLDTDQEDYRLLAYRSAKRYGLELMFKPAARPTHPIISPTPSNPHEK